MQTQRVSFSRYSTGTVELKGGINENVSSLELLAGELIDCKNYMIAEGTAGGYTSLGGYERLDGLGKPSETSGYVLYIKDCDTPITLGSLITGNTSGAIFEAISSSVVLSGSYIGGDAFVTVEALLTNAINSVDEEILTVLAVPIGTLDYKVDTTGGSSGFHAALDKRRTEVLEVPGEGPVLAVHVFEDKIYAFRKKVGVLFVGLYVEHDITGWAEIDTSGSPLAYGVDYEFHFSNYNFSATVDENAMWWCDGVNTAMSYNGTTVTPVPNINMTAIGDKPTNILAFNNHLFLVYRSSLQISTLGFPFDWTTAPTELGFGSDITNVLVGVQNTLVIYSTKGIKVLTGTSEADFQLLTHSSSSGARLKSAQRLLGTHFFLDDRGVTTLEAVDTFGDYAANSISQKFKKTLLDKDHELLSTVVSRSLNQYRMFFDDRVGIIVSFEGKELRGATFTEYNTLIRNVISADMGGREILLFTSDTGYVYCMDSGTSFDGIAITARLSTSFHHYGSPRQLKGFKRLTCEIAGESGQIFNIKTNFDYNEPGLDRTIWYSPEVYNTEGTAVYGESRWGQMVYGAASVATNRLPVYIQGVGTNVSIKFLSNEVYRQQHTLQNILIDYTLLNRRV